MSTYWSSGIPAAAARVAKRPYSLSGICNVMVSFVFILSCGLRVQFNAFCRFCQVVFLLFAGFYAVFLHFLPVFLHFLRVFVDSSAYLPYYGVAMLRARVKEWLKATGTSREELAERLLVSPATLEGWLLNKNPRPIPAKKAEVLEGLIAPKNAPGCIALPLAVPADMWECLTKDLPAGADKKKAVAEFLLNVMKAAADSKLGL